MKKIGFIGLGIMGKHMAKNLLKAGHTLIVYDINHDPVRELVEFGADEGLSSKDVSEKSDIILTIVPNSSHVKEVILGQNGVLEGARPGTIIVDMSSISPIISREVAAKVKEKGIEMLDAPVSGGEPKAVDGTLAFMVGGPENVYEQVKDILLCMGASAVLVGDNGSGTIAKLANQVIVNLNIAAMSEAFVLAAKAGIDPEKVYKAIRGGLAGSVVLDSKLPLILERNFKPGGRISINLKDIKNVMETAHEIDVPMPLTSQLLEIMQALKVDGKLNDDHGGIIQFYEKLAQVEVKKINEASAVHH